MMSIAYICIYLEIDEQFDITAKTEAEKELHADFSTKSGPASLTSWCLRRPIRL